MWLMWKLLADFGMARKYSSRPLTPGVVTIWYRAPELLLGTKHYTPSVDLWSTGLVLAELLLSAPCLTGEHPLEQLSLIVKLLGSPSPDDIVALSVLGCPDMIKWQREGLSSGRADNIERRFGTETSPGTVGFLKGLLKWDPRARWTANEALGKSRSRFAAEAQAWWDESPRAVSRELLPTFPEVRNNNGEAMGVGAEPNDERNRHVSAAASVKKEVFRSSSQGYVFDFEAGHRPTKRHRAG
jgi:cyclin-dependent kinase 10